jgi:hypothetical protein
MKIKRFIRCPAPAQSRKSAWKYAPCPFGVLSPYPLPNGKGEKRQNNRCGSAERSRTCYFAQTSRSRPGTTEDWFNYSYFEQTTLGWLTDTPQVSMEFLLHPRPYPSPLRGVDGYASRSPTGEGGSAKKGLLGAMRPAALFSNFSLMDMPQADAAFSGPV